MRTSFAAIAFALASVATSQLANIPSCALNCFVSALTTDGCSGLTDFACHCKKTDLIPSVTPCVQAACSAADQAKVITAVEGTCASAGVTISVAPATSAASASSSVDTSSTPEVSSTPVASSAPAGYSPAAVTPSATSSAVVTSLAGTGTLITASSNGTVTTASTPTSFTGAAAQVTQAAGIVVAALALAAAL
ncbi:CFEM-domain-containing protein [Cenococcum geophilum 1.58]|uniref:CFEM-domain-containing protein n=1 Tax=Cenococcum geophilum 1.58 TaxID=794803 RepID=UPI00358EFE70|nr:CFEM-domain-containing protein [Cenococcum geophilum 1.58]